MMKPHLLIPALLAMLAVGALHAETLEGDIFAVDAKAWMMTLSSKTKLQTYRMGMTTDITINGTKGKVGDLKVGMAAKVTSVQTGLASQVFASGGAQEQKAPPTAAEAQQMADLKQRLSGSTWDRKDGKKFTLQVDGTTTGSWHERKGFWKVIAPNMVEMHISWAPEPPERVTLNPDAALMRWVKGGEIAKRAKE